MELIRPGTSIDLFRYSKWALFFSVSQVLLGLASWWYHGGPNYGVDCGGGTVVQVKFTQPTSIADIRQALATANIANITVQDFGQGGNEFLIRVPVAEASTESLSGQIQQGLAGKFGEQAFEVRRLETVGPKVGKDLRRKAMLAVLFSTVMMGVYIAFRFEPRFGVGAAVALLHDVLITARPLSMTNMAIYRTPVAPLPT